MSLSCISTGPPFCYTECSGSQVTPVNSSGISFQFLNTNGSPASGYLYSNNVQFILQAEDQQIFLNTAGNIIQEGEPPSNSSSSTLGASFFASTGSFGDIINYGDSVSFALAETGDTIGACPTEESTSLFVIASTCNGSPVTNFQIVPICGSSDQLGDPVDLSQEFLILTPDATQIVDSTPAYDSNNNSITALGLTAANTSASDLACNYPIGSTLTCNGSCVECQGGSSTSSSISWLIIAIIVIITLALIFLI